MSEKTPRLNPRQATIRPAYDPSMAALSRRGAEFYHPPLTPDQQRKIGQLSLIEQRQTSGVGWPE